MRFDAVKFREAMLQKKRKDLNSIRGIAAEIGVHASTIINIQKGGKPDIESFGKICEWLGCDDYRAFYDYED